MYCKLIDLSKDNNRGYLVMARKCVSLSQKQQRTDYENSLYSRKYTTSVLSSRWAFKSEIALNILPVIVEISTITGL